MAISGGGETIGGGGVTRRVGFPFAAAGGVEGLGCGEAVACAMRRPIRIGRR